MRKHRYVNVGLHSLGTASIFRLLLHCALVFGASPLCAEVQVEVKRASNIFTSPLYQGGLVNYKAYEFYESATGQKCPSTFVVPDVDGSSQGCSGKKPTTLREQSKAMAEVTNGNLEEASQKLMKAVMRKEKPQAQCAAEIIPMVDANKSLSEAQLTKFQKDLEVCDKLEAESVDSSAVATCRENVEKALERVAPMSAEVKERQAQILKHLYTLVPDVCQRTMENAYNEKKYRDAKLALTGIKNEIRDLEGILPYGTKKPELPNCDEAVIARGAANLKSRCLKWTEEHKKYSQYLSYGTQMREIEMGTAWAGGDPNMSSYISSFCAQDSMLEKNKLETKGEKDVRFARTLETASKNGVKVDPIKLRENIDKTKHVSRMKISEDDFLKLGLARMGPFALQGVIDQLRTKSKERLEQLSANHISENMRRDLVASGAVQRYIDSLPEKDRSKYGGLMCHLRADTLGRDKLFETAKNVTTLAGAGITVLATMGWGVAGFMGGLGILGSTGTIDMANGSQCRDGKGMGAMLSGQVCEAVKKAKASGKSLPWDTLTSMEREHNFKCFGSDTMMELAGMMPFGTVAKFGHLHEFIRGAGEAKTAIKAGQPVVHQHLSKFGFSDMEVKEYGKFDGQVIVKATRDGQDYEIPVNPDDLVLRGAKSDLESPEAAVMRDQYRPGAEQAKSRREVVIPMSSRGTGGWSGYRFSDRSVPEPTNSQRAIEYLAESRRNGLPLEGVKLKKLNTKTGKWEEWTGGLTVRSARDQKYLVEQNDFGKVKAIYSPKELDRLFQIHVERAARSNEHVISFVPETKSVRVNGRDWGYDPKTRESHVTVKVKVKGQGEVVGTYGGSASGDDQRIVIFNSPDGKKGPIIPVKDIEYVEVVQSFQLNKTDKPRVIRDSDVPAYNRYIEEYEKEFEGVPEKPDQPEIEGFFDRQNRLVRELTPKELEKP